MGGPLFTQQLLIYGPLCCILFFIPEVKDIGAQCLCTHPFVLTSTEYFLSWISLLVDLCKMISLCSHLYLFTNEVEQFVMCSGCVYPWSLP